MAIRLEVVEGPMKGKQWSFEEHDTFIFGRSKQAHCSIEGDKGVSRFHFLLEANPPEARIRDLGSTNGVKVDGVVHGGTAGKKGEVIALTDGNRIQVGWTTFRVAIDAPTQTALDPILDAAAPITVLGTVAGKAVAAPAEAGGASGTRKARKGTAALRKSERKLLGNTTFLPSTRKKAEARDQADLGETGMMLRDMMAEVASAETLLGIPSIPGYRLGKLLGKGAMGAVYLASRQATGEQVAIKMVLPSAGANHKMMELFRREIEVMCQLRHPNIISFYEYGQVEGTYYLVLDYAAGGDLFGLMKRQGGALPAAAAVPIILQVLDGLAYAHARGFIHRDLKPANILLDQAEGRTVARVSDFGLSKNFAKAGLSGFTATGTGGGTPAYMPREQLTDFKNAKPASDVFSVGAMLYFMLTGKSAYNFEKRRDEIMVILEGDIVPIRTRLPDLPEGLEAVIGQALAVDMSGRYADAQAMHAALAAVKV